jgi:hypothetical protein
VVITIHHPSIIQRILASYFFTGGDEIVSNDLDQATETGVILSTGNVISEWIYQWSQAPTKEQYETFDFQN